MINRKLCIQYEKLILYVYSAFLEASKKRPPCDVILFLVVRPEKNNHDASKINKKQKFEKSSRKRAISQTQQLRFLSCFSV